MADPIRFQTPEETAKIQRVKPPDYDVDAYKEDKAFNQRLDKFSKKYTNSPEFARKLDNYLTKPDDARRGVQRFNPNTDYRYGDQPPVYPPAMTRQLNVFQRPGGRVNQPPTIEVDPARVARLYKEGSKTFPKGLRPEPHEMGHVGWMGADDEFSQKFTPAMQQDITGHMRRPGDQKWRGIEDALEHKRSPKEARADLHELRFYMHEAKDEQGNPIFDASKSTPFTKENLDAYRKKTGQHHRLFEKYDDEGVIWMMNNIAKQEQEKAPGMFTGRERYA